MLFRFKGQVNWDIGPDVNVKFDANWGKIVTEPAGFTLYMKWGRGESSSLTR